MCQEIPSCVYVRPPYQIIQDQEAAKNFCLFLENTLDPIIPETVICQSCARHCSPAYLSQTPYIRSSHQPGNERKQKMFICLKRNQIPLYQNQSVLPHVPSTALLHTLILPNQIIPSDQDWARQKILNML